MSMTANSYLAVSPLLIEVNSIVALVSVLVAVARPMKIPRISLDPGEASTRATRIPLTESSTRRSVVTTSNVHSSVRGCPSKTRTGFGGSCDVMLTFCDSVGERIKLSSCWLINSVLFLVLTTKNVKGLRGRRQHLGCLENSDLENSDLRPSGCLENSDPKDKTNLDRI